VTRSAINGGRPQPDPAISGDQKLAASGDYSMGTDSDNVTTDTVYLLVL
jgi:hypothetical protein